MRTLQTSCHLLILLFSFFLSTAQANDYSELQASADSKAKSAVKSTLRYLKRMESAKNPENYFKKILKYEKNIKKRDPSYDFEKLKAVAMSVRDTAIENNTKKADAKAAKKAEKLERKKQQEMERQQTEALFEKHNQFYREFRQRIDNNYVSTDVDEDDQRALDSLLGKLDAKVEENARFAEKNVTMLDELRQLRNNEEDKISPTLWIAWSEYEQGLTRNIDNDQYELVNTAAEDLAERVNSSYDYAQLAVTVMKMKIGVLMTGDPEFEAMTNQASLTFSNIPSPVESRKAQREDELSNAEFPEALYSDAALEEKFVEAFVGTLWGEKVVKVALKEKKWTPAFNKLGLFMGDTMAAWIGAVDADGRGKVYDFRILFRGEKYPAIRYNHEMVSWIPVVKIQ